MSCSPRSSRCETRYPRPREPKAPRRARRRRARAAVFLIGVGAGRSPSAGFGARVGPAHRVRGEARDSRATVARQSTPPASGSERSPADGGRGRRLPEIAVTKPRKRRGRDLNPRRTQRPETVFETAPFGLEPRLTAAPAPERAPRRRRHSRSLWTTSSSPSRPAARFHFRVKAASRELRLASTTPSGRPSLPSSGDRHRQHRDRHDDGRGHGARADHPRGVRHALSYTRLAVDPCGRQLGRDGRGDDLQSDQSTSRARSTPSRLNPGPATAPFVHRFTRT